MVTLDLLAQHVIGTFEVLKWTVGDFSDADLVTRPCPGANHAMWQLGHLCTSQARQVQSVSSGIMIDLPAEMVARFAPENVGHDDLKFFGTKNDLLQWFERVNTATVRWIKTLDTNELFKPDDRCPQWAPTLGSLAQGIVTHRMMHVGQFQVIRRKLGKAHLM